MLDAVSEATRRLHQSEFDIGKCTEIRREKGKMSEEQRLKHNAKSRATYAEKMLDPEYREKKRKDSSEWRKNNPEKSLEIGRRWREKNPERYKEIQQDYNRKHRQTPEYKEQRRAKDAERRAAIKADPVLYQEQKKKDAARRENIKNDPVKKAKQKEQQHARYEKIKADPVKWEEYKAGQRRRYHKRQERKRNNSNGQTLCSQQPDGDNKGNGIS